MNPKTIFTSVIHPPERGKDCNQFGKSANSPKGKPNASPKPAAPTVSGQAPCSATPTNKVPRMGPVQENETIAKVEAIKKIPPILPNPARESIRLAKPAGRPISNKPKKESANTINTAKNKRFSQTLVEILLNTSGLIAFPAT